MKMSAAVKNITKISFLFTFSLCYPFFSFAQTDISVKKLKKHITYLASDKLEGRGTGSKGEQRAAKYIAKQFKKMGLKPAGTEGPVSTQWFCQLCQFCFFTKHHQCRQRAI